MTKQTVTISLPRLRLSVEVDSLIAEAVIKQYRAWGMDEERLGRYIEKALWAALDTDLVGSDNKRALSGSGGEGDARSADADADILESEEEASIIDSTYWGMPECKVEFTALVVNNSLAVAKMLSLMLMKYAIKIDFVKSAAQAHKLLQKNTYDIVILGGILSDNDGYTVCRSIKGSAASRHIPVFIVTSKPSLYDRVRAALAGCDAYLVRPITDEVLEQVLRQHLNIGANAKLELS